MVALVVTVIALIILATVSISAVVGDNGIIAKAKLAKNIQANSIEAEQDAMDELFQEYANAMAGEGSVGDSTNKIEAPVEPEEPVIPTGPNGNPLTSTITSTNHTGTATEDTLGNPVYIPGGFKIAEDSGETVKEGIVVEDASGNQFVWIPVSNINGDGSNKIKVDANTEVEITLGRYTFDGSTGAETIVQKGSEWDKTTSAIDETYKIANSVNSSYYHYELATKLSGKNEVAKNLQSFVESVRDNHGYYLARYEASYASGSSTADYKPASKVSTANSTSSMSYTARTLWNFITQEDASKVCQNMYSEDSYVESDLVNSYAWDTAIVYIQAMGNSNYANQNRGSNTSLLNTGSTGDQKCKIFDMAGNMLEWTTEYCTNVYGACAHRGGRYDNDSLYTAIRGYTYVGSTYDSVGFRPLLYVK